VILSHIEWFGGACLSFFLCKQPLIVFLDWIYRADELGSGMRKMMKYGKFYGGEIPQMIEGDLFRMIIKVPEFKSFDKTTDKVIPDITDVRITSKGKKLMNSLEKQRKS